MQESEFCRIVFAVRIKNAVSIVLFLSIGVWAVPGAVQATACSRYYSDRTDKYSSFTDLLLYEREGVDFKITAHQLHSNITVIAPHAGRIEIGTSEIARTIASAEFNLYLFEGIKNKNNFDLHITSDSFDEPVALKMMSESDLGVSVHGYKDDLVESVLIGGRNKIAAEAIAKSLRSAGFNAEFPNPKFLGESLDNIVNRAKKYGVQLEISSKLRKVLGANPERLQKFAGAVRLSFSQLNFNTQL